MIRLFSPQKLPFYYIIRQEKVKVLIQIKNIIIKEIKNDIIIISSKGDKKTLSLVVGVYNIWHVILVSIKKQSNISNNNKMNRREISSVVLKKIKKKVKRKEYIVSYNISSLILFKINERNISNK